MGLPTTANYIVVSALMAPVIVTLGAAERADRAADRGAHVRVLLRHHGGRDAAGGLASFAAAAVSGGDPIKTGVRGVLLQLRTALLPFLFIFNTDLLLIDVDWIHGIGIFVVATIAMLLFAAATQGFSWSRTASTKACCCC
jgi:TRAP-type uncharacterized transport system fused permease subunit